MSDVRRVELEWLWPSRLPRGKICVLDGDPGVGKSSFTLDLAAGISSGRPFPDGTLCSPAGVVILSAEDDLGDTVFPRLEAAGACMDVIRAVAVLGSRGHERLPEFPDDLPRIEEAIRSVRAGLVIVDPFMAYLAPQVDAHKDQHVRRALAPLAQMAMRNRCSVLLVRHLRKSVDGPALYRGGGSIGIIAAARTGLLIGRNPQDENERVLAVNKSNLAKRAPSLKFRIEAAGNSSSRVVWLGESELTAEQLTGSALPHQAGERLQEAVDLSTGTQISPGAGIEISPPWVIN